MARFVIVTAGDDNYIDILLGLLRSIRAHPQGADAPVTALDLGFSDANRARLGEMGVRCVRPDWDYPFTEAYPEFFKAMVSRPHLPKYAGDAETIIWLDADVWVQDWGAIDLLLQGADEAGFAIVPELDRSYTPFYNGEPYVNHQFYWYKTCFDEAVARKICFYPLLNCGVFAARANAPHWKAWADRLADSLSRAVLFVSEQTALNVALRLDDLPLSLMPASCNWICFRSQPMCSPDGALLLDPHPPHAPLGIIHLAGYKHTQKDRLFTLRTPRGDAVERPLIYTPAG